jgi:hypothetical protein
MTEPDPYDLQAILDKGETAESMMIQEEINAIMFAPYDRYERTKIRYHGEGGQERP